MAVALDKMKGRTKVVTVKWDGEEIDVSYFPNIVTPTMLEDVDIAARRDDLAVLGVMLEPILDWWDILEEEGGPRMPTDTATIMQMPMSFLSAVQSTIQEDQNPPAGDSSGAS